jgi:hypothetical protein
MKDNSLFSAARKFVCKISFSLKEKKMWCSPDKSIEKCLWGISSPLLAASKTSRTVFRILENVKKVLIIEVGGKGKQSDGGTFAGSGLFESLQKNTFNVPPDQELPGTNMKLPNVMIGDEAYPLKEYLMRPYPRRVLTPQRDHFNKRLSRARKCIECAFGILYAKWRILSKDIETFPEKASVIVKCACLLHNLIRDRDGDRTRCFRFPAIKSVLDIFYQAWYA